MMKKSLLIIAAMALPSVSLAVDKLTTIDGKVQEAPGMSAEDITARALECLRSTAGNHADGVDPATSLNTAYAVTHTEYTSAMLAKLVRARFTVAAKDQRFKIKVSDIESYNDMANGYIAIQKMWGTGWKKAAAALEQRSATVSECITKKEVEEDW